MEDSVNNLDLAKCPSCKNENEKDVKFCVHCGSRIRDKISTIKWFLFLIISFILIGGIFFFWLNNPGSKPIASINGDIITKREFSKRLKMIKKIFELQYGNAIFKGENGKKNLDLLKKELLDNLIVEKLILQEAKKVGFLSAPKEEIEKELNLLKRKYNLTDNDFKKKMGLSIEEIKEDLQKDWITSQFIKNSILKGDEKNGEEIFLNWLSNIKVKAKIETFEKFKPYYTSKASCCTSSCGGGSIQPLDPDVEKRAKEKAIEYVEKKTQKKNVDVKVTNFGCHIQVDIMEKGEIILSLTYDGEKVQEI